MNFSFVRFGKCVAVALVVATAGFAMPGPASAQGIFDFLFRSFERRPPPPPEVSPDSRRGYAPDDADRPRESGGPSLEGLRISGGTGRYTAYCVRLCDGKYFPIQRAGGTAGELCNGFCPAAKTKIFSGTDVALAQASDGTRYQDLENAFVYRERTVDNCTCNGTDPYGLAKIDINNDPTVRRGDLVATADGLKKLEPNKRSAQAAVSGEQPQRQRPQRPPSNPFSFLFR